MSTRIQILQRIPSGVCQDPFQEVNLFAKWITGLVYQADHCHDWKGKSSLLHAWQHLGLKRNQHHNQITHLQLQRKSVPLYGCEAWRRAKTTQQKIQTFISIRWPEKISNRDLRQRAGQEPVTEQILQQKWGWIGYTLRKQASSIKHEALTWKRGWPNNSWRQNTDAEIRTQGTNWMEQRGKPKTECDGRVLSICK